MLGDEVVGVDSVVRFCKKRLKLELSARRFEASVLTFEQSSRQQNLICFYEFPFALF